MHAQMQVTVACVLLFIFLINGGYDKWPLWKLANVTIANESDIITSKGYEISIE